MLCGNLHFLCVGPAHLQLAGAAAAYAIVDHQRTQALADFKRALPMMRQLVEAKDAIKMIWAGEGLGDPRVAFYADSAQRIEGASVEDGLLRAPAALERRFVRLVTDFTLMPSAAQP